MSERLERAALSAYRAYHGEAAWKPNGLSVWQLELWKSVAEAAIKADKRSARNRALKGNGEG